MTKKAFIVKVAAYHRIIIDVPDDIEADNIPKKDYLDDLLCEHFRLAKHGHLDADNIEGIFEDESTPYDPEED